jgi:hypothetical protein
MPNDYHYFSTIFGSKNKNNNLQFGVILNNEVIVFNAFVHIFGMAYTYFSKKFDNFKK